MKLFNNKKGQTSEGFGALSSAAIGVVVFVIVVGIGSTILDEVQDVQVTLGGITNESNTSQLTTAYNLTSDGLTGMSLWGDFTSIIVLVAVAAVILGLIAVAFRAFT